MSEPKNYDFRRRLGVDMSSAKPVQGSQTEFTAHCPFCHNERKSIHQKQREFWFDTATGHYKCHNCGKEGRLDSEQWINLVGANPCGRPENINVNINMAGDRKGRPYKHTVRLLLKYVPNGTC